jgi:hypothetical protein
LDDESRKVLYIAPPFDPSRRPSFSTPLSGFPTRLSREVTPSAWLGPCAHHQVPTPSAPATRLRAPISLLSPPSLPLAPLRLHPASASPARAAAPRCQQPTPPPPALLVRARSSSSSRDEFSIFFSYPLHVSLEPFSRFCLFPPLLAHWRVH